MVKTEEIMEKLKEVIDPELGYDVVSLGEIEEIKEENNKFIIVFLPTTPLCPFIPAILDQIEEKMNELKVDYEVEIDNETKWSLDRVNIDIKKRLGL
ncbi:metal-sulfur cluster biosynthetic enzyme [Nanobdella aerobiophila]|uniref:Metal-sulfur cluster biosynthetic enzyme n=1 Tax=Nanobdella aerobiophila TaxID=2586965 RepID=A0A915SAE2_9ARCH|nr:iron-sulfur cluster assembly protein [Nanobdella aerobiophila]BBL45697.1 metal-sulfur cluster biosynthetic enzyme [Nanobdella aerobiophila]